MQPEITLTREQCWSRLADMQRRAKSGPKWRADADALAKAYKVRPGCMVSVEEVELRRWFECAAELAAAMEKELA